MKSFTAQITLDGVKTKVTIQPTEGGLGFGIVGPGSEGFLSLSMLSPEDRERIEFDIADLRKSESNETNEEPLTGAMSPKEKKMKIERTVLNSLLEKLGVENPAKFETERAVKKCQTRIGHKGLPDEINLTDDEKDAIRELGYGWLPAVGGSGKPADALAEVPAAPQRPEKGAKGGKATPKGEKPAKGKPTKAAKSKPANKAEGQPPKKERTGGTAVFVKAFPNKQVTVLKDDLVAEITAAGVSEASARAYIVWAKRAKAGAPSKGLNPFPFQIEEYKNKEDQKALRRIGDVG